MTGLQTLDLSQNNLNGECRVPSCTSGMHIKIAALRLKRPGTSISSILSNSCRLVAVQLRKHDRPAVSFPVPEQSDR